MHLDNRLALHVSLLCICKAAVDRLHLLWVIVPPAVLSQRLEEAQCSICQLLVHSQLADPRKLLCGCVGEALIPIQLRLAAEEGFKRVAAQAAGMQR